MSCDCGNPQKMSMAESTSLITKRRTMRGISGQSVSSSQGVKLHGLSLAYHLVMKWKNLIPIEIVEHQRKTLVVLVLHTKKWECE